MSKGQYKVIIRNIVCPSTRNNRKEGETPEKAMFKAVQGLTRDLLGASGDNQVIDTPIDINLPPRSVLCFTVEQEKMDGNSVEIEVETISSTGRSVIHSTQISAPLNVLPSSDIVEKANSLILNARSENKTPDTVKTIIETSFKNS